MIKTTKYTLRVIKENLVSLLLFCICYHLAVFAFLFEIGYAGISIALKQAGYSYITTENIFLFLREPITISMIALGLIILLFSILFEVHTVIICCEAYRNGIKLRTMELFIFSIVKFYTNFRKRMIQSILVTFFLFPIINLQLLVYIVKNIKVVRYIVSYCYSLIANDGVIDVTFLLFLFLCIGSVFILPRAICGKEKNRLEVQESVRIVKRNFIKIVIGFVLENLMLLIILVLLYIVLIVMATFLVSRFYDSGYALAHLLKLSDWITFFMLFLASVFGIILNSVLLYQMYLEFANNEEPLPFHRFLMYDSKVFFNYQIKKIATLFGIIIVCVELFFSINLIKNSAEIVQGILLNTQVTSHRAGGTVAPENTIAGLKYAVNVAADFAEIDVQETKDGEVILLHDSNLKRTTGLNQSIWNTTFTQVSTLDAGIKFGKTYIGEKIPTLEDAILYSKGKIDLNIELKYYGHNQDLVNKVVKMIEENHLENHCVLSSSYYPFLQQIKKVNPDLKTGYIINVAYGNFSNRIDADFLSIKHTYVTKKLVQEAHNSGKEIHVWTVDSRSAMERMKQLEVDNIITDRPITVKEVLASEIGKEGFVTLLKYVFQ